MRIALATIALNEAEHVPDLLEQHLGWPGLVGWVFVEGATSLYGKANPSLVTAQEGLSVDGTTDLLRKAASTSPLVHHVPHGWVRQREIRMGSQKERLRNAYCEILDKLAPDYLVVIDADEFYTAQDQRNLNRVLGEELAHRYNSFLFRQRHLWRPPSIAHEPATALEVVGGYWRIPHLRVWRWVKGARYRYNHNWLDLPRQRHQPERTRQPASGDPQCVHLGFARSAQGRVATNRYYVARGEGTDPKRSWYVDCRTAWEGWTPGTKLPHGAKVVPYTGPIPEVLR